MYDHYKSLEELIEAIKPEIKNENGEFFIPEPKNDASEIQSKLDKEIESNKKYRQRAQESERIAEELKNAVAQKEALITELNGINPAELREKAQKLATEIAEAKSKADKLEKENGPLREELENFRKREKEMTIKKALIDEATKLGVRPEAFRDVERLAGQIKIDEVDGLLYSSDGKRISDFVAGEIKQSPHWLPISAGGNSSSGTAGIDNRGEKFAAAQKNGNIAEMIANAPVIDK
ncbi:MAG: hypothetical protein Q4G69_14650 [Planctomycetia bacterium]|nr:hypothetical protein [Planctomycetia bacterium]